LFSLFTVNSNHPYAGRILFSTLIKTVNVLIIGNKNVDAYSKRRVSGLLFIRYAHNQKIEKPNNSNQFGRK
jgi:hypothetical protein